MRLLGLLVALLILLIGLTGVVAPEFLLSISQQFVSAKGIYLAAALRIGMGIVLVLAAPKSRAPLLLRVLGGIVFLAGVASIWIGAERAQLILDWAVAQGSGFIRVWAILPLVLGAVVTYALARSKESDAVRE